VRKVCIYHAGCPDGFGAAWAAWKVWGTDAEFVARGHDDPMQASQYEDAWVVFADIAPPVAKVRGLAEKVGHLVVLDHHVSAQQQYDRSDGLVHELCEMGHQIDFYLGHSGAVLTWHHFHPDTELPPLLAYVEDQDLWNWALPDTREINAAIGSYPRTFESWDGLAARTADDLATEGASLVRMQRIEVERSLHGSHAVRLGELRVEAVNAREHRSLIGHELAERARFGEPCGAVYRLSGSRVDISVYSIGEFDVSAIAGRFGGGGHRNAAGFSVPLETWQADFL
jgi:hypothetical protein